MWKCSNTQSSVTLWVQRNIHSRCLQLVWFFAVLLSALPHCRIFSKSTATREWLTYTLDILKFRKTFKKKKNGVETVKPRFSVDTLKKYFPREYFFAADRGDVYIIKGHKNLIAFISFASHSKVVHSEDHFSEEGLFGSRFSKSSFKFTGKWKVRVPSNASVSKFQQTKIMQICGSSCYK